MFILWCYSDVYLELPHIRLDIKHQIKIRFLSCFSWPAAVVYVTSNFYIWNDSFTGWLSSLTIHTNMKYTPDSIIDLNSSSQISIA